ncbi:hypothetical protein PF002_g4177 [Phytophthora fragariae]|nr:hypothetical protein PF003_g39046 [Phytophthora fragariae]KAE8947604.1 hypothetical protein PF009_g2806 [Phytophthora fragariae]KAE9024982.1 hypothetical protein PF011_g3254 [Phytophthora fragariae]KAE9132918.1 hypothetical protein PF007_g3543 [Phytophthora fragariae]KAE9152424.1 hypothetical protein PF006_g3366 [Phytophthora fragariae]
MNGNGVTSYFQSRTAWKYRSGPLSSLGIDAGTHVVST